MQFSARLICPLGDPLKNRSMQLKVDDGSMGKESITLTIAQNVCTWEGFRINGQDVIHSVMTGVGPASPDGTWSAEGYDFGTIANGDHYLARWQEQGDPKIIKGTWKLLSGTGSLKGITGEATFEEPAPKAGDTEVISTVRGWYQLP